MTLGKQTLAVDQVLELQLKMPFYVAVVFFSFPTPFYFEFPQMYFTVVYLRTTGTKSYTHTPVRP